MPAKRSTSRTNIAEQEVALRPEASEVRTEVGASAIEHLGITASETHSTLRRQPRQSRGHARVDLLLDAAATVIVKFGIQGTTAEAIALEARTAKGSLYQFFPNRDAVLAALALRYSDELRSIHERAFPADASGLTLPRLIDHIVRPLAEFHDTNPAFGRVFAISDASDGGKSAPRRIRSQLFGSVVERLDLLFATRNPVLPARDRRRMSLVAAAIGQAILARRDHALASEKKALLDDLRRILLAYLSPVLEKNHTVREPRAKRKSAVPRTQG
jgi:AcrR family transcriptional regulator